MWRKLSPIILKNLQKLSANQNTPFTPPVRAIDGPSASGKGTITQLVAAQLGYHYLDSGALYRIVALAAKNNNISWNNEALLAELVEQLDIKFSDNEIYLNNNKVTEKVRSEEIGGGASEVAIHPALRKALVDLQHSFRQAPGLVADGRDMATVIFPDAKLKIFLTATAEVRADRRYKQLAAKNKSADYQKILEDLRQRDTRDQQRSDAPLVQAPDALLLETSNSNIAEAVAFVINAYLANAKSN